MCVCGTLLTSAPHYTRNNVLTYFCIRQWIVFEGISVDETGKQHFLDASVAYKRAVLNAVDYLSKFGYTREQIYLLLSCAPSEGRISGRASPRHRHSGCHHQSDEYRITVERERAYSLSCWQAASDITKYLLRMRGGVLTHAPLCFDWASRHCRRAQRGCNAGSTPSHFQR
jgi:hypothetical protein